MKIGPRWKQMYTEFSEEYQRRGQTKREEKTVLSEMFKVCCCSNVSSANDHPRISLGFVEHVPEFGELNWRWKTTNERNLRPERHHLKQRGENEFFSINVFLDGRTSRLRLIMMIAIVIIRHFVLESTSGVGRI